MSLIRFLSVILLFLVSNVALAEGRCPDGYFPIGGGNAGWEGCAPMGPVQNSTNVTQSVIPARYLPQWGSIARGKGGGWGAVGSFDSEQLAKRAALEQCERSASVRPSSCGIVLSYYNQCVVYVWGGEKGEAHSAIDVPTATRNAVESCGIYSNECEILYSNCSYAKLVE